MVLFLAFFLFIALPINAGVNTDNESAKPPESVQMFEKIEPAPEPRLRGGIPGTEISQTDPKAKIENCCCLTFRSGKDAVKSSGQRQQKVEQCECKPLCKLSCGDNTGCLFHACTANCLTCAPNHSIVGPGGVLCYNVEDDLDCNLALLWQAFAPDSSSFMSKVARWFYPNLPPKSCCLGCFHYEDERRSVYKYCCIDCGNYSKDFGVRGYCGPVCVRCSVSTTQTGQHATYLCCHCTDGEDHYDCSLGSWTLCASALANSSQDEGPHDKD